MASPAPSAIPQVIILPDRPSHPSKGQEPPINGEDSLVTKLPKPKFRLEIHELRHPGSQLFIALIPDLALVLETALTAIISNLYTPPTTTTTTNLQQTFTPLLPATRSVTVLLRPIDGVAYTTGKDLDDDHKEIHVSLNYIHACRNKSNPLSELLGVITHELVHCYQYASPRPADDNDSSGPSAPGAPGGLIEGVADFVRLKAGLEAPHWKRPASAKERPEKWDAGYEKTAYFLEWVEDVKVGRGAVGSLNDRLARVGYVGEDSKSKDQGIEGFWKGLFGAEVDELWGEYGGYLDNPPR